MKESLATYDVAIIVVPNYSQLTLAALVEPMRMANTLSGRELYKWRICSDRRDAVVSSSGFTLTMDCDVAEIGLCDALFVVASYEARDFGSKSIKSCLRKAARNGTFVGGLDSGPYLMAAAGLLDGHRATTHWDDLEDFQNRFPRIDVVPERFVIDRQRATTSGSLPSFDFVLDFIRHQNGLILAMNVSGNFLYDRAQPGSDPQHVIAAARIGTHHPKIMKVIQLMEQSIQTPLTMDELAAAVGFSERTLLRRFREALKVGPHQYYRALRLELGKRLLDNHDLSITDIALACGFESRTSFARAFKTAFGTAPTTHRINVSDFQKTE